MKSVVVALAVIGLASSPAYADARAEAIVLFDQGIKDMKAGRLDKACAALQSSLELVKDSGTKGALARCHGLAGRIATAWLLWRELADTAPNAELRSDAAMQAAKLEPRLPRYTITLANPELVVEINGRRIATNVSVAVPIDPGKLRVSASRRDGDRVLGEPWVRDYTAVERQTVEIDVPALVPIEAVVGKPARPRPARPAVDDRGELADRRHRRHVIAGVLGVAALGGAGAGTWFGLQARSRNDEARQLCGGDIRQCPADQVVAAGAKVDSARSAGLTSTIAFAAAGAVAVVATIVWVTAPSAEARRVSIAPAVGPEQVGLVVVGAF